MKLYENWDSLKISQNWIVKFIKVVEVLFSYLKIVVKIMKRFLFEFFFLKKYGLSDAINCLSRFGQKQNAFPN